ncbi:MAG: radical SAM protein [Clostridia bacterium]|nr:radical SAM protein [Clostridia bacterium]
MQCFQCPVRCGADRTTQSGACGSKEIKIAKYYLHRFEEPPISFKNGSGCIFFCGCSLKCVFCQNFELSRNKRGKEFSVSQLADIFKELEDMGAENINLVNPTHYLNDIAGAIELYRPQIPIVYNTHGYETSEALRIADGFTDIWLTDLKFTDNALAKRYTARADYADFALPAVRFMAQKRLNMRDDGKMLSGCIIRHLILPLAAYDSVNVVNFVATLPETVYFSLMSQYTPYGDIAEFKELNRRITKREYERAVDAVRAAGLKNVFLQEYSSATEEYIPQWDY